MKNLFLLFLILFSVSINKINSQNIEKIQHFKLNPKELLSNISRSDMQDIQLGAYSISAHFVPNDIMSEEVQRSTKDIKTYDLLDKNDKFIGNVVISSYGVWLNYWEGNKLITVIPDRNTTAPYDHFIDDGSHHKREICGVNGTQNEIGFPVDTNRKKTSQIRGNMRNGDIQRTYKIALVCTGEFYQLNGNNDGEVNSIIIATMSGISALYLREMSIKFRISGIHMYRDPNNDPFIPDTENRTIQAGKAVAANFTSNSYDIGHALHRSVADDGWSSGGVARLSAVCRNTTDAGSPAKAKGWSGSYNNEGYSWYSLMGHELAHMFSALHTFNGTKGSCTEAISETNAFEIGSGTTIMSYNGLCDDGDGDNQQNVPNNGESDNYFHIASLLQITEHAENFSTCPTTVATNNDIPDITANPCGANIEIPKNTPFYLKGSGTDQDQIYYSWEQYDEDGIGSPTQGKIANQAANDARAPLFKCIPPSTTQFERYFPDLVTLAEGVNSDRFQVLSNRPRTLHFKLVGRDFLTNGGAYGFDDLEVTVKNSGPLTVTSPTPGTSLSAGEMTEISWNTNGSEDICTKAIIKLSTNGGFSYGVTLKEDVDFSSGSTMVLIPGFITNTDKARIMVACDDSDCASFFDIVNGDFDINSDCDAPISYICPSEDLVFVQNAPGLDLNLSSTSGELVGTLTRSLSEVTGIAVTDVDYTGCVDLGLSNTTHEIISVSKSGIYNFSVDAEFGSGWGFVSIFNEDNYSSSNPCNSFLGSSGRWGGSGGSVTALGSFSAELLECQEYRIVFYNYLTNFTKIVGITGPGAVLLLDPDANSDYSYGYIAVNSDNNILAAFSPTADFTSLSGGTFTIYGIKYQTGGANPTDMNDYVGQIFFDFHQEGDCYQVCDNPFELVVEGSCNLENASSSTQSNCNPDDNTFTQSIILTYSDIPESGEIMVGEQAFAITTSPQTIEYIAQSDGEDETVEIFFTDEPECKKYLTFTHKQNCCTFEIPFDDTHTICEADEYIINAGTGGQGGGSYVWSKDDTPIANTTKDLTVSEAGTYKVIVTSPTGCPQEATIIITVSELPTLTGLSDLSICENTEKDITISTNATEIKWFKEEIEINGQTSATLTINEGGNYKVIVTNEANCVKEGSFIVNSLLAPIVNLGDDKTACIGNEETFNAPTGDYEYEWSNNGTAFSTEESVTISESMTLGLTVIDADMCSAYDEVLVNFEPGPTLTIDKTNIDLCEGDEEIVTATTNASSIKWYLNGAEISGATTNTLTVSEIGVYTAHVEGDSGCDVDKDVIVLVHEYPILDLPDNAIGCEGETITLHTSLQVAEYEWTNNLGNIVSSEATALVTEAGIYSLKVTNDFNCSSSDNITVNFTNRPTVTLPATLDICDGSSETLTGTSDGASFQWLLDGQEITGETNKTIDVSEPGVYTLIAYNGSDCFDQTSSTVTTREAPTVDLGTGYSLCPGEEIIINASNAGATYLWSNGETTQSITIAHPDNVLTETMMNISVTVTNNFECSTTATTEVLIYPNINAQIDGDMGVCIGESTTLVASGGQLFTWSGPNILSSNGDTAIVSPTETSIYTVEVTDQQCSGQTETTSFEVEVYQPAEATGGDDKNLILGREVTLGASGGVSYIWSPESAIVDGQGTATPSVNPIVETEFTVLITDINGCEQTDTVLVSIIEDPLALLKHVTVITPNDDGMNDKLEFIGLETFPSNTLVIYNRWGNEVFEASNYQKQGILFDGMKGGEELPADTYFYILKFDNYTIKENLTIIREK